MFPRLTAIDSKIVNKIKNSDPFKISKLNVFVRLISGTDNGCIMISNPNWKLFEATGLSGPSFYGNSDRSGTIGIDWYGTPINVAIDEIADTSLKPSPIVTAINIKEGKDQISRHCDLKITAFTLGQVEIIQKYYMEPGHSINIEYGWNTDLAYSGLIPTTKPDKIPYLVGNRNLDYATLHSWRIETNGEYDSFFGFIVGGTVNSNGDAFDITIKLRGAPGLPTYLQSQFNIEKENKAGKITNDDAATPFQLPDLNLESADQMAERRFKLMFNQLPKSRQTKQVKDLLFSKTEPFSNLDFINLDPVIENQISIYRDGRTIDATGTLVSGSASTSGTNSTSTTNTAANKSGQERKITEDSANGKKRTDPEFLKWDRLNFITDKYFKIGVGEKGPEWVAFKKENNVTDVEWEECIKTRIREGYQQNEKGEDINKAQGTRRYRLANPAPPADPTPKTTTPAVGEIGGTGGFTAVPTGQANATEIMLAGGLPLPKEKLFSKNKYIRFGKAVQILNANTTLKALLISTIPVNIVVDILDCKIGAFYGIYSTKPERLLIPGWIPNFSKFFMEQNMAELSLDEQLIDNAIAAGEEEIRFAENTDLDADGFKEDKFKWGYLKNLYINFDFFKEEMEKPNRTMRDVLQTLLNEMSLAANSFWNFQIAEKNKTVNGQKTTIFTVYDENWVGKNNVVPPTFIHSGEQSRFFSADLNIEIPGAMMNMIINQRLSLNSNPDQKDIAVGGCFSKSTDRFFKKYLEVADSSKDSTGKGANLKDESDPSKIGDDKQSDIAKKITSVNDKAISPEQKKKGQEIIEREKLNNQNKANTQKKKDLVAEAQKRIKAFKALEDKVDGTELFQIDKNEIDDPTKLAHYKQRQKDIQAEIDTLNKQIKAEEKAQADETDTLNGQAAEFETAAQQAAGANISQNLDKIDIVPNPNQNTLTQDDLANFINNIEVFKTKFKIYCCRDSKFFNVLKINNMPAVLGKGQMSPPLPIKYSFTILGTSGIRRGDTFNIIGIPKKYRDHGFFQVTEIEQTIQDMKWSTKVEGSYRQTQ